MKTLLINNSTIRLKQTQEMLKNFEVDTVGVWELTKENFQNHDFIVLTGGNYATSFTKQKTYDVELDLIKNSNVPVFGICMGMQLIVRAFSPVILKKLEPRRRDIMDISYEDKNLKVFNSHKWAVPDVCAPLIKLSESIDGVEIVKHESKPVWGVQFHPEADIEFNTNGKLVFDDFISQTVLK